MNETMRVSVICLTILGGLGLHGQPFEVASVKLSVNGGKQTVSTTPGSVTMRNATLGDCIRWAYGVMDYQILNGGQGLSGEWMNSERYDIAAKAGQAATEDELKTMLQGLLADRFKLALHREVKEMQVLTMTVAKGGLKFHESTDPVEGSLQTPNDVAVGKGATMAQLAALASNAVHAPVLDMTGLTGRYDFSLDPRPYLPLDGKVPGGTVDRGAIMISAFQAELGLKIDSKKSPVSVVVIDHAEKPSDN